MDVGDHIANIGRLVEDQEFRMRNSLQEVYFGKMMQVVSQVRSPEPITRLTGKAELQKEMFGKILKSRAVDVGNESSR